MSGAYSEEDLVNALKQTASIMSVPTRPPSWVRPPWWAMPINVTRTRPIPAASGWVDYITVQLGQTDLAPVGYSIRLTGYVATGRNDPLTTGMTYRFLRNGTQLPTQEFDITNTVERHVMRYTETEPWPAFGRKMFFHVPNQSRLVLQVNNPSGAEEIAIAALYGYYYPNLGDVGRGGQESHVQGGWGHEDSDQGAGNDGAYAR